MKTNMINTICHVKVYLVWICICEEIYLRAVGEWVTWFSSQIWIESLSGRRESIPLCICVLVYLCICVLVYLCICVFMYRYIREGGGRMSDVVLILNLHWEVIRRKGIHSIDNFRNGTHKSWVHLTKLSLDFLQNNWLNWIRRFCCYVFSICMFRILYL